MRKTLTLLLALTLSAVLPAQTLQLQKGDHIAFVGVTTRVDKTIHKLIQRGRKGNCHVGKLARPPDFVQIGIAMVSRPFATSVGRRSV